MKDKILDLLGFDKSGTQSILFLHKLDKSMIPLCFLQSILSTILPYAELYFVTRIIDIVISGSLQNLLGLIFAFILSNLLLGVLIDLLQNVNQYKAIKIQRRMVGLIQEKVMGIDFEKMEDAQMLKKISDAKYAMEHMGGYHAFIMHYRVLVESWVKVVSSIFIIIGMCLLSGVNGNSFTELISTPFVSIVLLASFSIASIWISQYIAKKSKVCSSEVFKEKAIVERKLNYFTDNVFLNYSTGKDIRLFDMAELLISHHRKHMNDAHKFYHLNYVKKELNYDTLRRISDSILTFVSYIVVLSKVLVGSITIGELWGYIGVINIFNSSMMNIISTRQKIKLQKEFTKAFYELLNMEDSKSFTSHEHKTRNNAISECELEFHNVSFKYKNSEEYTLKNVSCKLTSGLKVAIVGRNGAGKTTFIKLLCRLYEPTEGYITLNGVDIKEIEYSEYVSLISVVFQDYCLFALPLRENVAVSRKPNDNKVISSLQKSGLASRVSEMSNGIATNLYQYDKDGVEISGGEAQKIAIARALYKDAPIIILDEPTASLDPISEYETYKTIGELNKNKTAIYISHRMNSCKFCDEIIVIEGGEIIQRGSHDDLNKDKDKMYSILYNMQAKHYGLD